MPTDLEAYDALLASHVPTIHEREDPPVTVQASPPPPGFDDTPQAYLDYILTLLQAEPVLPHYMNYARVPDRNLPVWKDDPWYQEWVRITKVVAIDIWSGTVENRDAVRELKARYPGTICVMKCLPFQLTAGQDPDNRYDLSTPTNYDITNQLNRAYGLLNDFIAAGWDPDNDINTVDLHCELWPWPEDNKYGNVSKEVQYVNRLHRYQAAYAMFRSFFATADLYWYWCGPKQMFVGDRWYTDEGSHFRKEDALVCSDIISPEWYRMWDDTWYRADVNYAAQWAIDQNKKLIGHLSLFGSYDQRDPEEPQDWTRPANRYVRDAWDGTSTRYYNLGAMIFNPSRRGESFNYLEPLMWGGWLYDDPFMANPHSVVSVPEMYRRFLMICRGAWGGATEDLAAPDHTKWGYSYPTPKM